MDIFPALIWAINLATLYFNDTYRGYNLVNFFHCESLQFLVDSTKEQIIPWHSIFNMSILKMISFAMDKHWAIKGRTFVEKESHIKKCTAC
jgi:protein-cysteine N-palmitoyltransferase HHAT